MTKKLTAKPAPKELGAATAAAILGIHPANNSKRGPIDITAKVKPEWAKYQQTLLELREQLMRQMNGLAKESAEQIAGYSLHMADSGTDNFDRDFALSLLSSDQDAGLRDRRGAEAASRSNTYGTCELTGKTIPKARLEAIPWTRFTVQPQAQLERDGALRQRRLGALGTVDAAGAPEVEDEGDEAPAEEKTKEKEQ